MSRSGNPTYDTRLNPLHAILLGFLVPLTVGAMLADWAYTSNYQIQWLNFADWLIAGSLVGGIPALIWAFLALLTKRKARTTRARLFTALLALTVVVNFLNSLTHAKDAYATMPMGLILSIIGSIFALAAGWVGFSSPRGRSA